MPWTFSARFFFRADYSGSGLGGCGSTPSYQGDTAEPSVAQVQERASADCFVNSGVLTHVSILIGPKPN